MAKHIVFLSSFFAAQRRPNKKRALTAEENTFAQSRGQTVQAPENRQF
jgi:hypothetical protein